MTEEQDERKVRLNGKVFLYRQKAPFVPSGHSVLGALEYDEAEDKVRCHECGEWFKHVGAHLSTHGITAREYRSKHGLKAKSALCGESVRVFHSQSKTPEFIERLIAKRSTPEVRAKTVRAVSRAMKSGGAKESVEFKNENGRCPAQILFRVQTIARSLGRTPSVSELREVGIQPSSLYLTFNVNRMSDVMSLIGLMPNPVGQNYTYTPEVLIEMLRDFYVKHGRTPRRTDFRRGLLPSYPTFTHHFGGLHQALDKAGLLEQHKRQVYETHSTYGRKAFAAISPEVRSGIAKSGGKALWEQIPKAERVGRGGAAKILATRSRSMAAAD